MIRSREGLLLVLLLMVVPIASANLIVPLGMDVVLLLPLVIIVESIVAYALLAWLVRLRNPLPVLGIVALANLVTSIIGVFLPFGSTSPVWLALVGWVVLYAASTLIEWGILLLTLRKRVSATRLALVSAAMNIVSYAIVILASLWWS